MATANPASSGRSAAGPGHPSVGDRIVVLHGKEAFLRTEWTRRLLAGLREKHGGIDEFRFPGTTPVAIVLDELRSVGLLSSHKAVIVDDADQFLQGDDRRRALERYAESPSEGATLVLRSETWRPGNFDKRVAEVGTVTKCEVASAAEAIRWATGRCERRHSATIEPAAVELLVDRLGTDLGRLDSELAKLAIAANTGAGAQAGAAISRGLVAQLVGLGREEQAWAIQEPVLAGDPGAAVRLVGELLEVARAPEVMISWSLLDVSRKVAEAADRLASGEGEREVSAALRLWGPSASAILGAARRVPRNELRNQFARALATDRALKTGRARDPRRTLEGLAAVLAAGFRGEKRTRAEEIPQDSAVFRVL